MQKLDPFTSLQINLNRPPILLEFEADEPIDGSDEEGFSCQRITTYLVDTWLIKRIVDIYHWVIALFSDISPSKTPKGAYINECTPDLCKKIFFNLHFYDFQKCCLVSKKWYQIVRQDSQWDKLLISQTDNQITKASLWEQLIARDIAFGPEKWAKYFGNVGEAPPLPKNIFMVLRGLRVKDWMLALIPKTVNEKPLTLEYLGQLAAAPKEGHPNGYYKDGLEGFREDSLSQAIHQSQWVLISRNIIRGSGSKHCLEQERMIASFGAHFQVPREFPLLTCIFTDQVSSGKFLYLHRSPRCKKMLSESRIPDGHDYCLILNCKAGAVLRSSLMIRPGIGMAIQRTLDNGS